MKDDVTWSGCGSSNEVGVDSLEVGEPRPYVWPSTTAVGFGKDKCNVIRGVWCLPRTHCILAELKAVDGRSGDWRVPSESCRANRDAGT